MIGRTNCSNCLVQDVRQMMLLQTMRRKVFERAELARSVSAGCWYEKTRTRCWIVPYYGEILSPVRLKLGHSVRGRSEPSRPEWVPRWHERTTTCCGTFIRQSEMGGTQESGMGVD